MDVGLSPTLLLVHGGSHGAWCWEAVSPLLQSRGHGVAVLDLPGCGGDPTPRAALTLDDSVDATVVAIDRVPAGPVVLVGHSIGGMLLPAVAAARPDRVLGMVFVAAVVLRRGERGIDQIPEGRRPSYFTMAEASGENSLLPGFDDAWRRFFPSLKEDEARVIYTRLTPQPFGPYLQPASTGIEDIDCPRAYILIEQDETFPADAAEAFAAKAGVTPVRVAGDHCLMLTNPRELATVLEAALGIPG